MKKICKLLLLLVTSLSWPQCSMAADGLTIDLNAPSSQRAEITRAANGIPVVNISAPSAQGVSHNLYHDYNVTSQGLILNNSSSLSSTQLAGFVEGNPLLSNSPARLILNEVTGPDLSNLNGYTEVAGKAADLIISNPNGIRVNGGGFINTPRVTLTTGTPDYSSGLLSAYLVDRGRVEVEGLGLNAANVDQFDIIARAVDINAEIWAKNLSIITGPNRVTTALAYSPLATSADQPRFALDSSALGGMYADRIRLIGTEAGVGVRLAGDMATTAADLKIELDGTLSLVDHARINSASGLEVRGQALEIGADATLFAQDSAFLDLTDTLTNRGEIIAQGAMHLRAKSINNYDLLFSGQDMTLSVDENLSNRTQTDTNPLVAPASIYALGNISVAGRDGSTTDRLENISATIESQTGSVDIKTDTLVNRREQFSKRVNVLNSQTNTLTPQKIPYSGTPDSQLMASYRSIGYEVNLATEDISLGEGEYETRTYYKLDIADRRPEEITRVLTISQGEEVIENTSAPAGIFAAENININAIEFTNSISRIAAGKDVNISVAGIVRNEGDALSFINRRTGRYRYCYKQCHSFWHDPNYIWAPLPETRQETVLTQIFSTISAGGAINISGSASLTNGKLENAALYSSDGTPSDLPARLADNQDFLLSKSRLFEFKTGSDHPFLIETRAEFSDFPTFISSDYMLERLGYDTQQSMKRLGDGFYETEQVRASLLAKTGRRFLSADVTDDQSQFQRLMDNAILEADILELTPGIALSGEQINALTRDIVWLVEEEVMDERVLVPKLYLGRLTSSNQARESSLITATDVQSRLGGELVNMGTVNAENSVQLGAENDILNRSGEIRGTSIRLESTSGDIINERLTREISRGSAQARMDQTLTGTAGRISSRGDLLLGAENIFVYGSQAEAGGVALLTAAGKIETGTSTEHVSEEANAAWGYARAARTRQYGSALDADTIVLSAGTEISVSGSHLSSTTDMWLQTDGEIQISAAQNSENQASKQKRGGFISKSTNEHFLAKTELIKSELYSGGSLILNNQSTGLSKNIDVIASNLYASHDLQLNSSGDINLNSATESRQEFERQSHRGSLSSRMHAEGRTEKTQIGAHLVAGGNLLFESAGNFNQAGSKVSSEKDVAISSAGNINILSSTNEFSSFTEDQKGSFGLFFNSDSFDLYQASSDKTYQTERTSRASTIAAAKSLSLGSGMDINLIGSDLSAGDNIHLEATRDINQHAAAESYESRSEHSDEHFGFSFSADSNSSGAFFGLEKIKDRLEKNSKLSAASHINADADLTINAGADILQLGSEMHAGQDAYLNAAGNIRSLATRDSSGANRYHEELHVGISAQINYNIGHAADSVKSVSESDNALTTASRGLRAIDAIDNATQPNIAMHFGASGSTSRSEYLTEAAVASSVQAGRNLDILANKEIETEGSLLRSGKDLRLSAEDIRLLAAYNKSANFYDQGSWKAGIGINASRTSASIGAGFSGDASEQDNTGRFAAPTFLQAGNSIDIQTQKQLELEGTQAHAGQGINLSAGQDIKIYAAQGSETVRSKSHQFGVEVGLGVSKGPGKNGAYLSANGGRSKLKDDGDNSILANLVASENLTLHSDADTGIHGASLKGKNIDADVGGNLLVASSSDQGRVRGNSWSAGATISSGGGGFNASLGRTRGSKDWVPEQTSILAEKSLDINVAGHTQLDAALIASQSENLSLTTGTFGYSDFNGHDKKTSVSAGFGISQGPGTGEHSGAGADKSGGNWSVEGSYSNRNRQQELRATIGAGEIIVHDDNPTGIDSLNGLNRDLEQAYRITKDKSSGVELYASGTSLNAVKDPRQKAEQWRYAAFNYGHEATKAVKNLDSITKESELADFIVGIVDQDIIGLAPSRKAHGGLATLVPNLLWGGDKQKIAYQARKSDDLYVKQHPEEFMPASELPYYDELEQPGKDKLAGIMVSREPVEITKRNATYQNYIDGMNNSLAAAIVNGMEQTKSEIVTIGYNPNNGLLGDLLECSVDKLFGNKWIHTGQSKQTGLFQYDAIKARQGLKVNFVEHSQGNLIVNASLASLSDGTFSFMSQDEKRKITYASNGSPVKNTTMENSIKKHGFTYSMSNSNKGDAVSEGVGGNIGLYIPGDVSGARKRTQLSARERINSIIVNGLVMFSGDKYPVYLSGLQTNKTSSHSFYGCLMNCGNKR